jgi:DNA-binding PadR family transcriptional regulator
MPMRNAMPMHPRMSPLQIMLLIQLEASPKYGYEMLKSIKEAFEGIWEPRTGTLYPAIKSLERRALVETKPKDGVDFYHITPTGRKLLTELGSQQALNLRFSSKFIEILINWMSPELKHSILSNIATVTRDDMNMMGGIIHFFDEGIEPKLKLQFLKTIRANLAKRLNEVDDMIAKMGHT